MFHVEPLTIDFPLPDRKLHPNGRCRNFYQRSRLTKQARETAGLVALAARPSDWKPLRAASIRLEYHLSPARRGARQRHQDDDGLVAWFKPIRDGMTDARIWIDDDFVKVAGVSQTLTDGEPFVRCVVDELK